jgi:ubiquinone biosynthesis protein
VEGIGKTLAPRVNFIEESRPFIKEMMLDRYNPERLLREAVDALASTGRFLRRFSQAAPRLLREMEQGQLALRLENSKLEELVREQRRASARQTRALIFGACVIAAALSYGAPGPGILGISVGAFLALCVGIVAGLPLLFDILRPPQ